MHYVKARAMYFMALAFFSTLNRAFGLMLQVNLFSLSLQRFEHFVRQI